MTDYLLAGLGAYMLLGAAIAIATDRFAFKHWLVQLFIVFDQLLNVLLTPFHSGAWADETMSARAYRAYSDGRLWGRVWMPVIDFLFFWQGPRHCERAFVKERERMHSPPPEQRNPIQGA